MHYTKQHKFMRYLSIALALCMPLCANESNTNKEAKHSHKLDSVRATASALATDVEKIPGSVSVVNSKQIQNMPNNKITDSIKGLAGVRVNNDVSFNPRPQVRIRGINYGTLIMLDNVILSDLEGENRILNQISLYDVERVEVARGAFSSLYGAGAIGGVINFITAMPKGFETQAILGYGNGFNNSEADRNTFKAYASVGDTFLDKSLRVKLSAGYSRGNAKAGFPTILPSGVTNTGSISGIVTDKAGNKIIGDGGERIYNTYDIRLKAEYDVSDASTLSSMISFSNHNYTFDNYKSYISSNGKPTDLVNNIDYFVGSGYGGMGTYSHLVSNLTYNYDFGESSLKLSYSNMSLFSKWQDARQGEGTQSGGAGTTQDIDSSSHYFDALYHMDLADIHDLNIATQLRYYTYTQRQRNMTNWKDYSTRTNDIRGFGSEAFVASVYVSLDSEWLDGLRTNIGARYDYWLNFNGYLFNNDAPDTNRRGQSDYASVFSPKFAISYVPDFLYGIGLKGSIGSGFRMPTMRDMYQFTHGNRHWAINQDLDREDALSFDIGVEYNADGYNASLYYYDTELWGMIYRSGTGTQSDPYKNVNAGRGRIHGVELSMGIPLWSDLRLEGSYTLTLATILKNDAKPSTIGKQLPAIPKHIANIALNYFPEYGFYGSLWAYYAPAFYADDINTPAISNTFGYYESQFTLNAKIGYNFKNGIDLSAQINNMTNNRYYDYYQVSGTTFYMQMRYVYR